MRRTLLPLILLAALAAPLAAAQTEPTAAARPSLSVDPASRDAAPGSAFNVTAIFANPTATPIAFALSFQAPPEVRLNYERWEVIVAPQQRAHVNATIKLPDVANVTHKITLLAQEKDASAQNAGRVDKIQLQAALEARVGAAPKAPPAALAANVEILVDPPLVDVLNGRNTTARVTVRNHGPAILAPAFQTRLIPGFIVSLEDVPATIPENGTVAFRMRVALPVRQGPIDTSSKEGAIALEGHAAATFRVRWIPSSDDSGLVRPPNASVDAADADVAAAAIAPDAPALDQRIVVAAALGSIGAAWTTLWLSRHKWLPLLAALYTRLRPSKMLDHPLRKRIVDLVQAEPGITFSDLARRLEIAPGQLTHHARMLEKAGIVFSSPDGQARRFFHVGHGRLDVVPPLAERALAAVRVRPMRASDLAKELGVSRQALHYHVKKLVADGKLVAMTEGGETILAAAPSAAAA